MNSGPTAERVFAALKARVLGNGFAPGARLDPAVLASDLASSVTPVREALHMLTGERLVETRTADGFHIPNITAPDLEDRYAVNCELLLLAVRQRSASWSTSRADSARDELPADRTAILFGTIAAGSANGEHLALIRTIGARLHAARTVETAVLADVSGELDALVAAITDPSELRKAILAYHRRRRRYVSEIVRALHRHDRD